MPNAKTVRCGATMAMQNNSTPTPQLGTQHNVKKIEILIIFKYATN